MQREEQLAAEMQDTSTHHINFFEPVVKMKKGS